MPFPAPRALLPIACAILALMPWRQVAAADIAPAQREQIETIIHDYLLKNPDVLVDALHAAQDKLDHAADAKSSQAVAAHRQQVFNDPATPAAGNPKGDVTLVEFFDYRCPYCKQVQPAIEALLKEDPKLRILYEEFPILGPVSVTAAHAALAAKLQGKYQAFHDAMMTARGNITDDSVYQVAGEVGLDVARLKRDMASPAVAQQVKANLALADALDIRGTPAFIVGDHVVPGAVDVDGLKKFVAQARSKG